MPLRQILLVPLLGVQVGIGHGALLVILGPGFGLRGNHIGCHDPSAGHWIRERWPTGLGGAMDE